MSDPADERSSATLPELPAQVIEKEGIGYKLAYISAGSALLGALIGAVGAYLIAAHQLSVQGDQSRNDFIRNQRQVAYSKLATDAQSGTQMYLQCQVDAGDMSKTPLASDVQALDNKLVAFALNIQGDFAAIEFVASETTSLAASTVAADEFKLYAACTSVMDGRSVPGTLSASELKKEQDDLTLAVGTEMADLSKFIDSGRYDLENS